ncbi:MAG TPA: hypothetical protein VMU30_05415 [Bacteroidota bacterium]|nr:hypothetical protein [Bacteroidota bacterium]
MAGKIKIAINKIIEDRSKGNATLATTTRTKMLLKGIDVNSYNEHSPDDPAILKKVKEVADELGINILI